MHASRMQNKDLNGCWDGLNKQVADGTGKKRKIRILMQNKHEFLNATGKNRRITSSITTTAFPFNNTRHTLHATQ